MPVKYVFVTGGVVSGLGKGITAASLGRLLKARGYKVTMQKFVEFFLIVEQRIQTLHLKGNLNLRLQAFDHFFSGDCFFFFGEKGRSGSCKQMGKLGDNGVLFIQLQGADKAFTQLLTFFSS